MIVAVDFQTVKEWAAHYVFYGTMIVTSIAVCERISQTFEEWLKEYYPDSKWIARFQNLDYALRAANDLLNRFIALNVRDLIVKRNGRRERSTDVENVKAQSAGSQTP